MLPCCLNKQVSNSRFLTFVTKQSSVCKTYRQTDRQVSKHAQSSKYENTLRLA